MIKKEIFLEHICEIHNAVLQGELPFDIYTSARMCIEDELREKIPSFISPHVFLTPELLIAMMERSSDVGFLDELKEKEVPWYKKWFKR